MNRKENCTPFFVLMTASLIFSNGLRAQETDQGSEGQDSMMDEAPAEADLPEEPEQLIKRTSTGKLIHWKNQSFVFVVTPTDVIPTESFVDIAKKSATTWNDTGLTPEILVESQPGGTQVAEYDGVNAVFFVTDTWDFDPRFTILTFTHVDGNSGEILEADVAINAVHHNWDPGTSGEPIFDLQNVLTHEFGHALGLPDFPRTDVATMYAYVIAGEVLKRDLAELDYESSEMIYTSDEIMDDEGGESQAGQQQGGCSQTSPSSMVVLLLLGLAGFALRTRTSAGIVSACILAFAGSASWAQETDADRINEEREAEEEQPATTLYAAPQESSRLPASDLVIEADNGDLVKVRIPGKIDGTIHTVSLHHPLPAPGEAIDLTSVGYLNAKKAKKSKDAMEASELVASLAKPESQARVIHREAIAQGTTRLPATDLIMKDQDGVVYKVRVPEKQSGAVHSFAIHHHQPKTGATGLLPPHAKPLHVIEGLNK